MDYRLHPEAAREHEEQVSWYQERQPGLGERYHRSFLDAVTSACATPDRCKRVRAPDIRRLTLKGFPSDLIYRDASGEIQVLAVAHHKRRPEYWAGRLEGEA